MQAKDIMTRDVVRIDKDDRLDNALDLMRKHRVSKLVVTDKKAPVGILTDGDIADELGARKNRGIAASHLHASTAMRRNYDTITPEADLKAIMASLAHDGSGLLPVMHDKELLGVLTGSDLLDLLESERPLSEVMTDRLHVVSPTDRVIHARRTLLDHEIERLPVLDGGKLVGIVGELDVALGLVKLKSTTADRRQSAALERFTVREIMQPTLITATVDMTAKQAAALMRTQDVAALPVLRGERLVGIVTRTDLLGLMPGWPKE